MPARLVLALLAATFLCGRVECLPRAVDTSRAQVTVYPDQTVLPLKRTLFGINVHPHAKANIGKPEVVERVKKLGIASCRFPNGCVADLYNWKDPGEKWATVDEFLQLCEAIDAEPYYTVNLQGGTEGLPGPAPEGLPLDETIRYQHLMPNPCGNTNYHYGTLAETLEFLQRYTVGRALEGRRPILHYEMGNENWGQSRTDWPPEVYARTVEVYAKAMRGAFDEARQRHPELSGLRLYICAVGYPVMGNNMKLVDTPDRTINIVWTGLLNKLHEDGLIDAVQEHFYPYASANGGALAWAAHNLHNIIQARKGLPNARLGGYRDPAIAYEMPMEFTEWNVKCWGPRFAEDTQLANAGFEDGLSGWQVSGGSARAVSWAARRGSRGLRVEAADASGPCEVSQVFESPDKAKTFVAGVWVRTSRPEAIKIQLRKPGGEVLGGWEPKIADTWERVVASAKMPEHGGQVEFVLRVEQPASAYFDEVRLYHTSEDRGQCPISATTYEQALFCVDAFREMALAGSPRSHLHHLFGDYPCGTMTMAGQPKDLAKAFELFAGAFGESIVRSECRSESLAYYSAGNPWATDFNALAPNRDDIPALACMASRTGDTLHVLLINRSSDRDIEVGFNLNADPAEPLAALRTLTGEDIDLPGAVLTESTARVGRTFTHTIEPYSAHILSVRLN